ncbi:XkdQ/YqbQ family protein [Alkaliphilus peptidifermentans]|uniref:YqbQ/XkdQ domain-containing protein n=1 Tax=Alkaliphilus peptidifermentans DSM 18978 TaxID=1120976 RepID=A0A1G5JX95_9FIRM|nr:hypothetical protein [Alkaliphilus peptidifermentans]SCY92985.1 hypothetical protein SAMN03080606_03096 [Alkaliphilus peptidifermentans DSM 18978]
MVHQLWLIKEDERIDITPMVGDISWQSNIDQLGQQLDFNISFNDARYFPKNPCSIGDIILLKNQEEIFRGIIVSEQNSGRQPLQYSVLDFAFYLNKSQDVYQFNSVSADKAITQILRDFNVPIGAIDPIPTLINKIYKDKVISDIIKDILDTVEGETGEKYRMEMDAGRLYIQKQSDLIVEGRFRLADNLQEHNLQAAISSPSRNQSIVEMKNSVKLVNNNSIVAHERDNTLIEKYGLLQQVIEIDDNEMGRAKLIAENSLKETAMVSESNSLTMMGDDTVKAGRIIEIEEEITGMKGKYLILSCRHTLKNRNHTMSLDLGVYK